MSIDVGLNKTSTTNFQKCIISDIIIRINKVTHGRQ